MSGEAQNHFTYSGHFIFFSSDMPKNQRNFFFQNCINSHFYYKKSLSNFFPPPLRPESKCKFLFSFFFLRRGTKHPCRSSSTKQYSESCLMDIVTKSAVNKWLYDLHRVELNIGAFTLTCRIKALKPKPLPGFFQSWSQNWSQCPDTRGLTSWSKGDFGFYAHAWTHPW